MSIPDPPDSDAPSDSEPISNLEAHPESDSAHPAGPDVSDGTSDKGNDVGQLDSAEGDEDTDQAPPEPSFSEPDQDPIAASDDEPSLSEPASEIPILNRVTDDHLQVDPHLLGRPLATPRRRAAALGFDLVFSCVVVLLWTTLCGFTALHLQAPSILPGFWTLLQNIDSMDAGESDSDESDEDEGDSGGIAEGMQIEVMELMARRRPELITQEGHDALEQKDYERARHLITEGTNMNLQLGQNRPTYFDRRTNTYHLTGEFLYGPYTRIFGGVTGFLIYFAFAMWLMGGSTPGKWLMGIRVCRLDGRDLTLRQCFGRAGGYSAGLSTFGMGFWEAFSKPNRQTTHDRVAGTVVIRIHGGSLVEKAMRLFGR